MSSHEIHSIELDEHGWPALPVDRRIMVVLENGSEIGPCIEVGHGTYVQGGVSETHLQLDNDEVTFIRDDQIVGWRHA